jgi:membrane protein implicated in regulation of membrane protease activity
MLVCMIVLGFLVAAADLYALTLPRTYWRSCLISILAVNGMFLSRFTLWQYFYQALYMILPILLLIWLFDRNILKTRDKRQPSAARGGMRLAAKT